LFFLFLFLLNLLHKSRLLISFPECQSLEVLSIYIHSSSFISHIVSRNIFILFSVNWLEDFSSLFPKISISKLGSPEGKISLGTDFIYQ